MFKYLMFLWCLGFLAYDIHIESYGWAAFMGGMALYWLVLIFLEDSY